MSIRLRLTLLYTAILAVTLASLGAILYGTQHRSMVGEGGRMIRDIGQRLVELRERGADPVTEPWDAPPRPPGMAPEPRQLGHPRRLFMKISTTEPRVVIRSDALGDLELPLSDAGRLVVLRGEAWQETAYVGGERMLIYSAPVRRQNEITEIAQVAQSLAEQEQYLATLRRNLLLVSGIAILIAFGLGWLLAGVVLRPIDRITQTAQEIGAERDFSRRVSVTGPNDEIGRLATTFNDMLDELEAAYQQQQQFVADVSHELRTPLTTLRGNLDLLRRQPPISDDDRTEVLSDMVDESQRLVRLVNDLLTLVGIIAIMASMNIRLSLVTLASIPVVMVAMGLLGKAMRNAYRDVQQALAADWRPRPDEE